jgi:hypothetical protein
MKSGPLNHSRGFDYTTGTLMDILHDSTFSATGFIPIDSNDLQSPRLYERGQCVLQLRLIERCHSKVQTNVMMDINDPSRIALPIQSLTHARSHGPSRSFPFKNDMRSKRVG